LRSQSGLFLVGQLEHEILREAREVAPHGLVETSRGHPVERGEVGIEQHLVAADERNPAGDRLGGGQRRLHCALDRNASMARASAS